MRQSAGGARRFAVFAQLGAEEGAVERRMAKADALGGPRVAIFVRMDSGTTQISGESERRRNDEKV